MLVGQPARPVTLEWERALKEWVGGDVGQPARPVTLEWERALKEQHECARRLDRKHCTRHMHT